MTAPRFDDLIHASTRLSIVSLLAASEWAEFKFIRDTVGLSDSALSKQLTTLEEAGYVTCTKGFEGRVPRTEFSLTEAGRRALQKYLDHMEAIIKHARSKSR